MTLAQVVYSMSSDQDFASQLLTNPEATLVKRGLKLSKEELAFLLTAHKRSQQEQVKLEDLSISLAATWR
ncbi:MAG TPA: hypothetical protein VLA49_09500 [Anaerolineales bacterium]|nr:hypothetical protein [Anaerolineales bacterium]